jgi:P-type Ca2+ transporter type 2C
MHDKDPHGKPVEELVSDFRTHLERGLTQQEAEARLRRHGPNELHERPRPGFFALLLDQFDNYLVIILVIAALVSLALGEYVDSVAIMFIVALNAVVGVVQESKAEQALAALKRMSAPNAAVIREGHQTVVASRDLVAGDIVLLEAGNFVPADLRLVLTMNLKVEEASLTGESVPVEKNAGIVLDKEIPLGDRTNSAFMGTLVTYGRGRGLVTATGMNTQIGMIAEMLQSFEDEETPLQRKLADLGKVLGSACLAICAVVFVYGLFRDAHLADAFQNGFLAYLQDERKAIVNLFMIAVSLAIAAVPEGLPAIVTICLALGMQRMIKHHALIRKLPAVETLGCATVVCSDKTGTLTQNQMTVVQAWTGGNRLRITGEGYAPTGQFFAGAHPFDARANPDATRLLEGALLCNDARLEESCDADGKIAWRIIGDPTEAAMAVASGKAGYQRDDLEATWPRVQEIPFDSDRKRMSTIHRRGGAEPAVVAFVKGAPDVVLDLCVSSVQDGKAVALTPAMREAILEQNREMASAALRVLAVAYRPLDEVPASVTPENVEHDLVFVGLLGMMDPARPEVVEALKVSRGAGLKSIMVTGDYKDTAQAIARDIGLLTPGGLVLTGAELDQLSDEELAVQADRLDVCCRVSPQHKTRIVEALKSRGHVVAMTGDGVNDAPALKRANIGVAMGVTGTDVAKQTADMVLTDDNFASIVAAIEQGRIIYSNIRKFVYFLLACNVGEILIVFGAMLLGMPIPLRPVQLLWLNLVSDGAPALALGLEKGDPDIMKQPPRSPKEHVINRDMAIGIGVVALVDALAILSVFYLALQRYPEHLEAAQTIAFLTLCCSELLRAFTARSEYHSIFSIGFMSNRWMVWAVAVSFALVLAVVYVPFFRPFFDTVPPGLDDWLLMLPFLAAAPIAMELLKAYFRWTIAAKRAAAEPGAGAARATSFAPALGAERAGRRPQTGGQAMKVLVPVDASHNCEYAVRHVVRRFMNDSAIQIHLLNVQPPFSRYVSHLGGRRNVKQYHLDESEKALQPCRRILDNFGIPYAVHMEVGDKAEQITGMARRLHIDEIVMGTSRKDSLTRMLESSVTNRVLELTPVPVEVVAGDPVSPWERYGLPAAVAALIALFLAAID